MSVFTILNSSIVKLNGISHILIFDFVTIIVTSAKRK